MKPNRHFPFKVEEGCVWLQERTFPSSRCSLADTYSPNVTLVQPFLHLLAFFVGKKKAFLGAGRRAQTDYFVVSAHPIGAPAPVIEMLISSLSPPACRE